jgi:phosphatidylinositol kinase/protein kinase (PI-3  family)
MNTAGVRDRELKAAEYLQAMRALSYELERAMQAIARNALAEFEESVAIQQLLSGRLGELAQELSQPLEAQAAEMDARIDQETASQIHTASGTLQKLNLRYAALLQHSSRSVALMASLFRSYSGQFQEASGPRLKHQTWSCQM